MANVSGYTADVSECSAAFALVILRYKMSASHASELVGHRLCHIGHFLQKPRMFTSIDRFRPIISLISVNLYLIIVRTVGGGCLFSRERL